jgi:hypothetical protein
MHGHGCLGSASGERSHSNSNHLFVLFDLKVQFIARGWDEHPKQALSRPTKK